MPRRSTKYYRKNEEEVMSRLGLRPTKNSGAGWIEKEDGQNDYVICQLKSTDAHSISVKQYDIETLEHNALVSHKLPVFAIQYLQSGEIWLMAKPVDFAEVAKYIETGACEKASIDLSDRVESSVVIEKVVKSSESAREQFNDEIQKKYKKEKKAW